MSLAKLPSVRGRDLVRALEKAGFDVVRIRGSHHVMRHKTDPTRRTIVPVHSRSDLGSGLLKKILDEAKLTPEDLKDLL